MLIKLLICAIKSNNLDDSGHNTIKHTIILMNCMFANNLNVQRRRKETALIAMFLFDCYCGKQ